MVISLQEFEARIERDYAKNKFLAYGTAALFLLIGNLILYEIIFINNFTYGMDLGLFVFSATVAIYLIVTGARGFAYIPVLTQIYKIGSYTAESGSKRMIEQAAYKAGLRRQSFQGFGPVIRYEKPGVFDSVSVVEFYFAASAVFAHVRVYNHPLEYMTYHARKKLVSELQREFDKISAQH